MNTLVSLRSLGVLAALALVPMLAPRPAQACGGLFCDGGPMSMPVDQSGENILFVWKDTSIEVHIQIQYVGDAAKFGWVIPLQSVPEFSVGSEPLFQALLAGSVPTYGYTQTQDDCGQQGSGITAAGGSFDDGGGESGGDEGIDSGEPPGPEIIEVVRAGAFEITVIQGDDAQQVATWLDENGYLQDPEALPILQEYIDGGFIFGAVKLTGGAGLDQIHPIVLRFQGSEPCVPLKLTRIAAVDNMAVRTFFLGDNRMVPENYRHVVINQVKLDWVAQPPAANYVDVITMAVDEENANGRAFVTEYAGPSDVVNGTSVYSPAWDPSAFQTADPTQLLTVLESQSLIDCYGDFAPNFARTFRHPLIGGLLGEFVAVPSGELIDAICDGGTIDTTNWDGTMFAEQMALRIVAPAQHAAELLANNDYLTRMYTTISPAEMTEDPLFQENADLEPVASQLTSTRRVLCNGDNVWMLPDGREIYLPAGAAWPQFPDEPGGVMGAMPASELIEIAMPAGAPMNLTLNTPTIDAVVAAHNEQYDWVPGSTPDSGDSEAGQDGEGGSGEGCGCTTDGHGSPRSAALALVALGWLRRRRRA
jgi:uncharacterized protein (TIGR03382 family)